MKTIGIIAGMSWESSQSYYRLLNEGVNAALGRLHSAKIILYSVDFEEIENLQATGKWEEAGAILAKAAAALERAGADFILIATNTMHKVAPQIEAAITVPLLHIADATAEKLRDSGITKAGLLGTRYTMLEDFYKARLAAAGIGIITPEGKDIDIVNTVIFDELCKGMVLEESRRQFQRIIGELKSRGAEGVILGCTEIGMLVDQADSDLPIFDTTLIHAQTAVEKALTD